MTVPGILQIFQAGVQARVEIIHPGVGCDHLPSRDSDQAQLFIFTFNKACDSDPGRAESWVKNKQGMIVGQADLRPKRLTQCSACTAERQSRCSLCGWLVPDQMQDDCLLTAQNTVDVEVLDGGQVGWDVVVLKVLCHLGKFALPPEAEEKVRFC
ncbi:hypothetical protein Btru_050806 [Bulinus truncatus]|nr:hypothetical protein Btru_050806 [Bulinus truncatus]